MKKEAASGTTSSTEQAGASDIKEVTFDPSKAMALEIIETEAQTLLFSYGESTFNREAVSKASEEAFTAVTNIMKKNNIEAIGKPISINEKVDFANRSYRFKAGLPIAEDAVGNKRLGDSVLMENTYAGSTIQVKHIGSYETLPNTYAQIAAYIKENGHAENGPSWEQYLIGPTDGDDASWVTMVYQPIAKPVQK